MRLLMVFVMITAAMCVGCKAKPKEDELLKAAVPVAPVETPEQIATKIRTPLAPLKAALNGPDDLTPEVKAKMVTDTRGAITTNTATENGKQAIAQVATEMEGIVRAARDAKKWQTTLAAIELVEIMAPGNTKYAKIKEQCNLYLSLPKVTIKGFFNVDTRKDEIYAFLHLKNSDGTQKDVKVRPGEEFDGCRFVRIIGNQQGVELEFLKLPGEFVQVMK